MVVRLYSTLCTDGVQQFAQDLGIYTSMWDGHSVDVWNRTNVGVLNGKHPVSDRF